LLAKHKIYQNRWNFDGETDDTKEMNAFTDGIAASLFTIYGSKISKDERKKKIQASGGLLERSLYAATLWNTLEGTAKRAEKDRERFSGSTHASPSSKFCA